MKNDWIKVFETSFPLEAEIVKTMLIEHGISAVVMNKQSSSFNSFGFVEVMVNEEQASEAILLIEKENDE
jgi:3-dehydroquinate synthase class II